MLLQNISEKTKKNLKIILVAVIALVLVGLAYIYASQTAVNGQFRWRIIGNILSVPGNLEADIEVAKTSGLSPYTVLFNGANSTGNIVEYVWDFGSQSSDGTYPRYDYGRMAGHRFDVVGTHNVTLTVFDDQGNKDSASIQISVVNRPSTAKTYYISPSGNDSADGLSQATAWQTIDRITLASTTMTDASQILFKKGGTYTNSDRTWNISKFTRTNPNYIKIGAYGSGDKPVLNLKITTEGAMSDRGIIVEDIKVLNAIFEIRGMRGGLGNQLQMRNVDIENGQLVIHRATGVSVENVTVNNCPKDAGVSLSGTFDYKDDYVTKRQPTVRLNYLNNLKITNSSSHGIYAAWLVEDVLIENSTFKDNGLNLDGVVGIRDGITAHGAIKNLIIRNNTFDHNGYALGLGAGYNDCTGWNKKTQGTPCLGYWLYNPEYLENVIVENNVFKNQVAWVFYLAGLLNSTIRNNLVYNNPVQNGGVFTFLLHQDMYKLGFDYDTQNLEISHNTFHNNSPQLFLFQDSDVVESLSFKNNIVSNQNGATVSGTVPGLDFGGNL